MNKRFLKAIVLASMTLGLGLYSCNKDIVDPKTETPTDTNGGKGFTPYAPVMPGADATLVSIEVFTTQKAPEIPGMPAMDDIELNYEMGVASFKGNGGKVGSITLNGNELKFQNGSYLFMPQNPVDPADDEILDFKYSGINWVVTSPDFQKSGYGVPGMPKITSAKEVTMADGYAFQTVYANADSVVYMISGSKGTVIKTMSALAGNPTFTPEELSNLGATEYGMLQATAIIYENEEVDGKDVWYIKEACYNVPNVIIK